MTTAGADGQPSLTDAGADDPCCRLLVTGQLGVVTVAEWTARGRGWVPGPRLTRRSCADRWRLDVMGDGAGLVEQSGREIRVRSGDLLFLDPSRPVRYLHTAGSHVSVLFPRTMVPSRPEEWRRLPALVVPGDRGVAGLAATLVRQLPVHLAELQPAEAVRLGTTLIDLVAVTLSGGPDSGPVPPPETRRRALRRQMYAYIDAHLGDPDLTPARVAAVHHISLRYAYRLFEDQDVTVGDWIRRRRLDRCRRDLLDPALRTRPVHAVAARWGLPNAAHFSRMFKSRYGMSPAEYRAVAYQEGQG